MSMVVGWVTLILIFTGVILSLKRIYDSIFGDLLPEEKPESKEAKKQRPRVQKTMMPEIQLQEQIPEMQLRATGTESMRPPSRAVQTVRSVRAVSSHREMVSYGSYEEYRRRNKISR